MMHLFVRADSTNFNFVHMNGFTWPTGLQIEVLGARQIAFILEMRCVLRLCVCEPMRSAESTQFEYKLKVAEMQNS